MTLLITGAAGTIGTRLAADLAVHGVPLRLLDQRPLVGGGPPAGAEFVQADLRDLGAVEKALRVWYAADAIVRHAGSGSIGAVSPRAVYYGQRNLEWTWIKNTPLRLLAATALSHAIYSLAGVLHYVRLGLGGPALRGKLAALARLPAVIADRSRVQSAVTANPADVEALMEPQWLAVKRREKAFMSGRRA